MSIRIALVGPLPPPSGGMANQTRQLARLLSDAGLTVTVVQVNAPYKPAWIERVIGLRAAFRLVPYVHRLWQSCGAADLVHVMANSGWAWHLFAAPAVWIAWLRGKPVVVNYRGGEADEFLQRQLFWIRPTLNRATAVVVPSGFLEAVFGKRNFATVVVPNIIDLARFQPAAKPRDDVHVVVARNLEDLYDIPTALHAFERIHSAYPNARLSVAGSGPKRAELEQLSDTLGLSDSVTFTGRLDNEQMADLYRTATLMLNPSLADNMPISLLEAMASGLPIVTTDVGGIPHLVRHEDTALLVKPRDAAAMADGALKLLGNAALSERLRSNGLQEAKKYSWDKVRERLFLTYTRALGVDALPLGSVK